MWTSTWPTSATGPDEFFLFWGTRTAEEKEARLTLVRTYENKPKIICISEGIVLDPRFVKGLWYSVKFSRQDLPNQFTYLYGVEEEGKRRLIATFDTPSLAEKYLADSTAFQFPGGLREFFPESLLSPYHKCYFEQRTIPHNPESNFRTS